SAGGLPRSNRPLARTCTRSASLPRFLEPAEPLPAPCSSSSKATPALLAARTLLDPASQLPLFPLFGMRIEYQEQQKAPDCSRALSPWKARRQTIGVLSVQSVVVHRFSEMTESLFLQKLEVTGNAALGAAQKSDHS